MTAPNQATGLGDTRFRGARFRVRAGAVVVLLLAGLAVAVLVSTLGSQGTITSVQPTSSATETNAGADGVAVGATIYVHILGAVARPGLYELREGDRAIDVIAAAGGFSETADRAGVNLARFLSDGEQIQLPAVGEVPAPAAGSPGTVGGKVNLNTADAATLETLPRIGPAMSARIIEWRETNGRFSAIEELTGVGGIGEKTFAALKDLVTV